MIIGILKKTPGMVRLIRFLKRLFSLLKGYRHRRITNKHIHCSKTENWFCGYYDTSPFNVADESLVIIHSTKRCSWRVPTEKAKVKILLYNWREREVKACLGETYAWNWQQGSRAMWLDEKHIIFNVYNSNSDEYNARIVDIEGNAIADLPLPLQTIDSNSRIYSLSYKSLHSIRPDYGYRNHKNYLESSKDDSIEVYDLSADSKRSLISIAELITITEDSIGCVIEKAKVNHILSSPDGDKIIFVFRYYVGSRRVTDLYSVITSSGSYNRIIADKGVCHYCWWDNDSVLASMLGERGFGYYIIHVHGKREPKLVWQFCDGHPSKLDENRFITDTYPDKHSMRDLLIKNIESGDVIKIAAVPEPLLFQGETRCDLHPSISPSHNFVQVDCAVGHQRGIAIYPLPLSNG